MSATDVDTPAQLERLRSQAEGLRSSIAEFDFEPVLDVYVRDYTVPREVARDQLDELVRYLILCRMFPDEHLGMKGPVDHLWHSFLICTRHYSEFCGALGGFVHHDPCSTGGGGTESYGRFLRRYEEVFGQPVPSKHWPAKDQEPIRSSDWAGLVAFSKT